MNPTLDPKLKSWVESANDPDTDFPIQNLPFCVYRRAGTRDPARVGVGIGDQILDLAAVTRTERQPSLNTLMAAGPERSRAMRARVSELLAFKSPEWERVKPALIPMSACEPLLPAVIGDYTDFYASAYHATNVGRLFRPDNPLLPNYKYVPIGYHGRASSVVISDTPVVRPHGQRKPPSAESPQFGPTQRLDYELELGFFVGQGNALGTPIPIEEAADHIFGCCLVNDWSARDIQAWEYQPLGPFLAKSFATSISPWVVTLEALTPFRVPPRSRPAGDPEPLPYLHSAADQNEGAFDITLEVWLQTATMRQQQLAPVRLSQGSFQDMYWTPAQLLAHHASNGCNLRPGDLIASGTVSGPEPEARGCLLELTRGGAEPLRLPNGETRTFLEDGDEIAIHGRASREGFVSIGLGECRGRIAAEG